MKKFLFVAAIAATFAACKDDKKTDSMTTDTTMMDTSAMSTDAMMTDTSMSQMTTTSAPSYAEGDMIMKGGKVMTYKANGWVEMAEPKYTSPSGVVVTSKGEVTMKQGDKPMMMTEGQWMRASDNSMMNADNTPAGGRSDIGDAATDAYTGSSSGNPGTTARP